jgi:hypothetical protein
MLATMRTWNLTLWLCRPRASCCGVVPWGYADCDSWWKCSAPVSSNRRNPLTTCEVDPHWWTSLVIKHWRTAWWSAQVTVSFTHWDPVAGFLPFSLVLSASFLTEVLKHVTPISCLNSVPFLWNFSWWTIHIMHYELTFPPSLWNNGSSMILILS